MTEEISADLVRRLVKAAGTDEISIPEEHYARDAELYMGPTKVSVEHLREVDTAPRPWNIREWVFDEIRTGDDWAVAFTTTTMEWKEDASGFRIESGADTFKSYLAAYFEFEGDKVTKQIAVNNRESMLSSMGVLDDTHYDEGEPETDLLRDELRLQYREVLTRLLRHNVRNKTTVIRAIAEELQADESTASLGRRLRAATDDLEGAAEKAREVEQQVLFREVTAEPVAVGEVAKTILQKKSAGTEAITTISGATDYSFTTDRFLLASVLEELVENAIQHADESPPEVTIDIAAVDTESHAVEITVTDNGPGIPEFELGPIRAEQETDLEHASGIGLWKIKRCVDRLNGDIAFQTPNTGGAQVSLSLPTIETVHD